MFCEVPQTLTFDSRFQDPWRFKGRGVGTRICALPKRTHGHRGR